MIDFSSSLYLGMTHPTETLRPWRRLTTGLPAALGAPPISNEVARRLAALQGCQRAFLGSSTLHIFWDLFGILTREPIHILADAGAYQIARWGAERAAAQGALVSTLRHYDANTLIDSARDTVRRGLRPIILADGLCPACGRVAPIADYLQALRTFGGLMVLDDTQALGILGRSPDPVAPYGLGGGGTLRWSDISDPAVIVISSLAKGLGVPVATIAGSDPMVSRFEQYSETRKHCSPPSIAIIHAAEHALDVNKQSGESLRLRLGRTVHYFPQANG